MLSLQAKDMPINCKRWLRQGASRENHPIHSTKTKQDKLAIVDNNERCAQLCPILLPKAPASVPPPPVRVPKALGLTLSSW